MKKRIFVDTNVMLDLLAKRTPFREAAERIFSLYDSDVCVLVVASLSFSNAAYVLRHKLSFEETKESLRRFSSVVEITSVDEAVVRRSIDAECLFTDIEDAMQHYAAVTSNCDLIITRNVKDFKHSVLPVCTPDQFIEATGLA